MSQRRSLVLTTLVLGSQLIACGTDVGDQVLVVVANPPANADVQDAAADEMDVSLNRDAAKPEGGADVSTNRVTDAGAGPPPTARSLLAAQSDQCNVCAYFNCSNFTAACDSIAGSAVAGPAAGIAKAELCAETVGCALSNGCKDFATCYCGRAAPTPDGICIDALQRSLETTVASEALGSVADYSKGGGWAMMLVECLSTYCDTCFPVPADDAADADDLSSVDSGYSFKLEDILGRCGAAPEDAGDDGNGPGP